jgi:predicted RNA binding protein YcfA (HicA-like mRNA interferase family)
VRIPLLSGREAARVFERAGFVFDHQRGSHMIYYREADGRHISPFPTTGSWGGEYSAS